jgi:isoquinoline 1-oxidoreductase beta subunit
LVWAAPRNPSGWRWPGKPFLRTDMVANSTGTFRYGGDLVQDRMIHATVVTIPAMGGGVLSVDDRQDGRDAAHSVAESQI